MAKEKSSWMKCQTEVRVVYLLKLGSARILHGMCERRQFSRASCQSGSKLAKSAQFSVSTFWLFSGFLSNPSENSDLRVLRQNSSQDAGLLVGDAFARDVAQLSAQMLFSFSLFEQPSFPVFYTSHLRMLGYSRGFLHNPSH